MEITVDAFGRDGAGTPGPVSVSVRTYSLGPSRTPESFARFPDLCNVEGSDALGQWTAFFPGFHVLGFVPFTLENLFAC